MVRARRFVAGTGVAFVVASALVSCATSGRSARDALDGQGAHGSAITSPGCGAPARAVLDGTDGTSRRIASTSDVRLTSTLHVVRPAATITTFEVILATPNATPGVGAGVEHRADSPLNPSNQIATALAPTANSMDGTQLTLSAHDIAPGRYDLFQYIRYTEPACNGVAAPDGAAMGGLGIVIVRG